MSTELLIFSLDGAMADTDELHLSAFNMAFARVGIDLTWSTVDYQRLLTTGSRPQLPACYREQVGAFWSDSQLDDIESERVQAFNQLVKSRGVALQPGVSGALNDAEKNGYRIAVITCHAPSSASMILESLLGDNWPTLISAVAAGDGTRLTEVSSEMYRRLLRTIELPANTAIAFCATAIGVRAADSAGIRTIALPTRWTIEQDFSDAQLTILPDMEDSLPLLNMVGINNLELRTKCRTQQFSAGVGRAQLAG